MATQSVMLDADAYLGVGLYTVSDTAHIVSQALEKYVTQINLKRWAFGRKTLTRDYAPIITSHLKVNDSYLFSFSNLVELFTIATLRKKHISLKTVRHAYERARNKFGDQPFAKRQYSIDGSGIFSVDCYGESDMEELSTGRIAFEEVVKPLLQNVSYTDGMASMFSPLGTSRSVVLDPERSFGSPINKDTGVQTSVLYGMCKSGEPVDRIAQWYSVSIQGVRDALEYERELHRAA